jgi:hypothetical protein
MSGTRPVRLGSLAEFRDLPAPVTIGGYQKRAAERSAGSRGPISDASTVAEVLETYGAAADRIRRRHRLYSSGCHHSTAESIAAAGRQHGIDPRRIDLRVRELARACDTP